MGYYRFENKNAHDKAVKIINKVLSTLHLNKDLVIEIQPYIGYDEDYLNPSKILDILEELGWEENPDKEWECNGWENDVNYYYVKNNHKIIFHYEWYSFKMDFMNDEE